MPLEFKLKCGVNQQKIVIHEDGVLEMLGYDPEYEELAKELGEGGDFSLCYYLYNNWDTLIAGMEKTGITFKKELTRPYYEYQYSRWGNRAEVRSFNMDDLGCLLAKVLKDYIEKENQEAIDIAKVIGKLPVSQENEPDIEMSDGYERGEWEHGVQNITTHTLKVCDVEIMEWEHYIERRIYDIFNFETDITNLCEEGLECGPTKFQEEIIKAIGLEDPEPDPPGEFGTPAYDKTGKGAYGVMYEEFDYDYNVPWKEREKTKELKSVEVVVYDDDRTAFEAATLAKSLVEERGDNEYEITAVRRKSPSERAQDRLEAEHRAYLRKQRQLFDPGFEDPEEPDPIYTEWTELERHSGDRPEDFED